MRGRRRKARGSRAGACVPRGRRITGGVPGIPEGRVETLKKGKAEIQRDRDDCRRQLAEIDSSGSGS